MNSRRIRLAAAALLALQAIAGAAAASASASRSGMTEYRVYQNDQTLQEFVSREEALEYARGFRNSRVESIASRSWVWDNLPRYQVYQFGMTRPEWEFRTYEEALAIALTLEDVHIRYLEQPGWVYSDHADYQLFQGDRTMPSWRFSTLSEAKAAAEGRSRAHIIELSSGRWVWDNLTKEQEAEERRKAPVYELFADGVSTGGPAFAYLRDAVDAAAEQPGSEVVHAATGKVVHSTLPPYTVVQDGKELGRFHDVDHAAAFAGDLPGAQVVREGAVWWTSVPWLQVYPDDRPARPFHTLKAALVYAGKLPGARIVAEDGTVLWNGSRKLLHLGLTAKPEPGPIEALPEEMRTPDIVAPSWFTLTDANGLLADTSDPSLAERYRKQGRTVVPVLGNRLDTSLTGRFLANAEARESLSARLADRLAAIGASGILLDIGAVAPDDRGAFVSFAEDAAAALHRKGLTISVMLPGHSFPDFDAGKLAGLADRVVIAAREPNRGLQETEVALAACLSLGIPRGKLMLGMPSRASEHEVAGTTDTVGSWLDLARKYELAGIAFPLPGEDDRDSP